MVYILLDEMVVFVGYICREAVLARTCASRPVTCVVYILLDEMVVFVGYIGKLCWHARVQVDLQRVRRG